MIGFSPLCLRRLLPIGILVAGVPATALAAKLYKWVDEHGQVHYSEIIPPQYRDRANVEIDRRGWVLRRNEALEERRRQIEEEASRKQVEEKRNTDQGRRDKALLETYTNEAEIDLARDRTIAFPQQVFESYEPRIRTMKQRGEALRAEKESLVEAGKPVPGALVSEMAAAEKELGALLAERQAIQTDIEQIRERYAAQKARYRELTGLPVSPDPAGRIP
jgi:chromosome segregation ATPase